MTQRTASRPSHSHHSLDHHVHKCCKEALLAPQHLTPIAHSTAQHTTQHIVTALIAGLGTVCASTARHGTAGHVCKLGTAATCAPKQMQQASFERTGCAVLANTSVSNPRSSQCTTVHMQSCAHQQSLYISNLYKQFGAQHVHTA
jgi:hypothetical protein